MLQKVRGIEESRSGLKPKSLLIGRRHRPALAKRLDASVRQLLAFVVVKVLGAGAVWIVKLVERVAEVVVSIGVELDVGVTVQSQASTIG